MYVGAKMKLDPRSPLVLGVGLLLVSTLASTLADGSVKQMADRLEAPQVFFLSGLIMAGITLFTARIGAKSGRVATGCLTTQRPGLLVIRSVAMVIASLGFFYAVKLIPLAEMFLFVGLMPLMSAVLSRLILRETVGAGDWLGLGVGLIGLTMLFPEGISGFSTGHLAGLVGAGMGTLSLVVARLMARYEQNALVQVFYPNLALSIAAIALLPSVWSPMGLGDLFQIMLYSSLLFVARWTMVLVMQRLRAPVALPLLNIQFAWMVGVGFVFFGEVPQISTVIGALLVMGAGIIALTELGRVERRVRLSAAQVIPAE